MGHADGKDSVFCFDAATGRELWRHSYPAELGDKFFDGGTTGTPTIDGERVYTLSRWGDTFCFQASDGKVVWTKNVQQETGARLPDWGFSGAPLVQGDRLILNVGEAGLALNKMTGALLWKSAPKSAGYSTPLPLRLGDEELVVLGSGQSYLAVALRDGKEAFRVRWLTQYGVNASDPVMAGDQMFLSTGYDKGAALFKLSGPEPQQLWKSKALRTQLNAAVLFEGHLYGADGDTDNRGALKCVELASGRQKWAHDGFGTGGLVIADGKMIALSAKGEFLVAPASPSGFKPTARAQLLGGKCWTAPVLAGGRIFGRSSRGDVLCLDVRTKSTP
jgi:outer membrane protein assembly factor BamB